MNNFLVNNMETLNFIIVFVLCIIIFIQININIKTKNQLKKYFKILDQLNEYDNTGDAFKNLYHKLEQTNDFCAATKQRCENTENKVQKCIQKVGFIKYSAHDTGKNELSFAIAMLDNNNDGIVLNEVHTRNTSNIYAKQIEAGNSIVRLSEEENIALDKALKDKDFVKREKM